MPSTYYRVLLLCTSYLFICTKKKKKWWKSVFECNLTKVNVFLLSYVQVGGKKSCIETTFCKYILFKNPLLLVSIAQNLGLGHPV